MVKDAGFNPAHGFFASRLQLEIESGEDGSYNLADYRNIPGTIGAVVSGGKASLIECQTVYSLEDIYLLLEINSVDYHNQRVIAKANEAKNGTHH